MKQLPNNLLHEGYILIPKALLKRQINDKARRTGSAPPSPDTRQLLGNHVQDSADRHRMPTRRIRHQPATLEPTLPMEPIQNPPLLSKIQEEGIIKIIPHQKGIFHIHINNYDFWTGCISPEAREEKERKIRSVRRFLG